MDIYDQLLFDGVMIIAAASIALSVDKKRLKGLRILAKILLLFGIGLALVMTVIKIIEL